MSKFKSQPNGLLEGSRPEDYILGANSPVVYEQRNLLGDWEQFLGKAERQSSKRLDRMACVTYSGLNSIECQLNWMLANNLLPEETLNFLRANGYIDERGQINCSDRFNAKLSGTTRQGNYFYNVWDSFRKDGLVPEKLWPDNEDFDWDQYYSPIPDEVKAIGKQFLEHFAIQYEYALRLRETIEVSLKHCPHQIAITTCPGWDTDHPQVCSAPFNHAVMMFKKQTGFYIYDHYEPFKKKLPHNYAMGTILKGIISPIKEKVNTEKFNQDIVFGENSLEVTKLRRALNKLGWLDKKDTFSMKYDSNLADAVFRFQLANLSRTFKEMLFNLKGKRFGPKSRHVINNSSLWN